MKKGVIDDFQQGQRRAEVDVTLVQPKGKDIPTGLRELPVSDEEAGPVFSCKHMKH